MTSIFLSMPALELTRLAFLDAIKQESDFCGIVSPANRHRGGGVEVIFPKGTPAGTTSAPVKLPDY